MKVIPLEVNEVEFFYSWHCHIRKIGRSNMVTLIHDETRLSIFIYGLLSKDFKNIDKIIKESVRDIYYALGGNYNMAQAFVVDQGEISFTNTSDRTMVARMNHIIQESEWFMEETFDPSKYLQQDLCVRMSDVMTKGMDGKYTTSLKELRRYFEADEDKHSKVKETVNIKATQQWKSIPADIRHYIVNNCFCRKCGVTRIVNYYVGTTKYGLLLEGECQECGQRVNRVVD